MELFSEIYGGYYRVIDRLLRQAAVTPLAPEQVLDILGGSSFSECAFHILPKLRDGDWPLLPMGEDGRCHAACLPPQEPSLSLLQRSWLKSLLFDPRIRLFLDDGELAAMERELGPVPPLYHQDDFHVFDNAVDGDDYVSERYRQCFKAFLSAINGNLPVSVEYASGKGKHSRGVFIPFKLEYSARDDKFRVLCRKSHARSKRLYCLNLGRVVSARLLEDNKPPLTYPYNPPLPKLCRVRLEITRERNALERFMAEFAHLEKRSEYAEDTGRYLCEISYNVMDETEIIIRVLSFGPTIRVLGPQVFLDEIKHRVNTQRLSLHRPPGTLGAQM